MILLVTGPEPVEEVGLGFALVLGRMRAQSLSNKGEVHEKQNK
jgi:hypothetical protein